MNLTTNITSIEKLIRLITSLKGQDLLLIGCISFFILSIGALTGYIPSPLLTMMEQHAEQQDTEARLVKIAELQLYLSREICLQGAETATDRARCDRQSIKDVILSSAEDAPIFSTLSAVK